MFRFRSRNWLLGAMLALLGACASQSTSNDRPNEGTYEEDAIFEEVESFFGKGAEGIADVLNKIFSEKGRPNAYIKGEEAAGAIGIGVRYGHGTMHLRNGDITKVYWRGPSIGIDAGGNVSKTFVLIYDLPSMNSVFQRFPGVDGSLYFVGGVGMNYNRADDVVLAPIRFGVGWRQGINIGYVHLSNKRSWVPF